MCFMFFRLFFRENGRVGKCKCADRLFLQPRAELNGQFYLDQKGAKVPLTT